MIYKNTSFRSLLFLHEIVLKGTKIETNPTSLGLVPFSELDFQPAGPNTHAAGLRARTLGRRSGCRSWALFTLVGLEIDTNST